MKILIAGTKKDLGMSQQELSELIEEHEGEVVEDADEANFMIATETEINKK